MKSFPLSKLLVAACACVTLSASADIQIPAPVATKGTKSGRVDASWSRSEYAVYGYNVYRTPTAEYRNPVKLGKTNNLFWVDRTAQSGRKYWYWIAPIYHRYTQWWEAGRKILTREVYEWYSPQTGTAAFNCQEGFKALAIPRPTVSKGQTKSGIYLTWGPSPQARYGYSIYRGTSPSGQRHLVGRTSGARNFLDRTAQRGTTYYYWICPRCFNFTPLSPSKYDWGYF